MSMIEKVATAIAKAEGCHPAQYWLYTAPAAAAIEALREPTEKINMAVVDDPTITVSIKFYNKLLLDVKFLEILRSNGVDNWEWYGESLYEFKEWEKENDNV